MSERIKGNDAENTDFTFRKNLVHHKPGFEKPAVLHDADEGGNHRFRARDEREVPKEPLAARLEKLTKGG